MKSIDSARSLTLTKEELSHKKLHPLKLRVIVKECATIVQKDMCRPEQSRNAFLNFNFSVEEAVELWERLKL